MERIIFMVGVLSVVFAFGARADVCEKEIKRLADMGIIVKVKVCEVK